jgi:hypothetical protein
MLLLYQGTSSRRRFSSVPTVILSERGPKRFSVWGWTKSGNGAEEGVELDADVPSKNVGTS